MLNIIDTARNATTKTTHILDSRNQALGIGFAAYNKISHSLKLRPYGRSTSLIRIVNLKDILKL